MGNFFITSPIYYVNDRPHIGHAYTTVACDVLARWKRLRGHRVLFATGTDEYGQKIEQAARSKEQPTQEFVNFLADQFQSLAMLLNIQYDDFVRTTESRHTRAVQEIWKRLEARGALYSGAYKGWYAVRDEAYVDESEITKGSDGKRYAPSGAEVTWLEQPSYFFRLSEYQDRLLEHYRKNPEFVQPASRAREVISFVESGLRDLSVSRTQFSWGVRVPGDDDHVIYVWLDALTNYLTVCGFPDEKDERAGFWPANVHVVGKDIVRFHAVYWPAILMAAGLPLPKRIYAHGWWTNEGQKISKSLGNVIDPLPLTEEFGVDGVRYFLMRELPFGQDGDFRRKNLIARTNDDLGNDFGNLCQRVLRFIDRWYEGKIPEPQTLTPQDDALLSACKSLPARIDAHIEDQAYHRALEMVFAVISEANRYVNDAAPWNMRTKDPARAKTSLYVCCEAIRCFAYCLSPFIPFSAQRVMEQLGYTEPQFTMDEINRPLPVGQRIGKVEVLFPKVGDKS